MKITDNIGSRWESMKWRIFGYYTLLILLGFAALMTGYHQYERKTLLRDLKQEFQVQAFGLVPYVFGGPGREGPPPPPPLSGERGANAGDSQRPPRPRDLAPPEHSPSQVEGGNAERGGAPPLTDTASAPADEFRPRGPGTGRASGISTDLASPPPFLADRINRLQERDTFLFVVDRNGAIDFSSDQAPVQLAGREPGEAEPSQFFELDGYFVLVHRHPRGGKLFLGKPVASFDNAIARRTGVALAWGLPVVAAISGLGFLLLQRSLRPIATISAAAERIAKGDLSERIEASSQRSELGGLARTLNETFDRLERAMIRQTQFTADASHELRTPVAAILADCQFSLKKPRTPERYRETIEVCHQSALHMRSLVEDLADLAIFDEDSGDEYREIGDLDQALRRACDLALPLATSNGVVLKQFLQPARFRGDETRITQAVLNLLGNAIRYSLHGGTVALECSVKAGRACITVNDNGCGIPREKLDRIFERFYRVDASRSEKTGGSGLGLSITQSIVQAHGGAISVESELGKGTCFRIELPVVETEVEVDVEERDSERNRRSELSESPGVC